MVRELKKIGDFGENYTVNYLNKLGFLILDVGVNFWGGEIDIVALKDDIIHFVEVKTRTTDYVLEDEVISKMKLKTLIRSAERYLSLKKLYDINWQIDLMYIRVMENIILDSCLLENITF